MEGTPDMIELAVNAMVAGDIAAPAGFRQQMTSRIHTRAAHLSAADRTRVEAAVAQLSGERASGT
jgi:hypothetical protein